MKRLYFLLTLVVFLLTNALGQAPTNGLVAYYPFNGNANDAVGSNHGTVNSAALTTDRFGEANRAINTSSSQIEVPSTNSLSFENSSITISGWVRPTSTWSAENRGAIAGKGGWDIGNGYELLVRGDFRIELIIFRHTYMSVNPILINEWTHIVGTFNNSTKEFKLYFNGVPQIANLYEYTSPPIIIAGNSNLTIGRRCNGNRFINNLIGSLDDIRLYNRALSDTEVQQLYQAEAPPTPPTDLSTGLVAHYKMDGNAQDASGNGNHGTAQNGVTFAADRFGNAGKAASFDGVNDRIMVNNHASLNFSSSFSSSFWVKMNVWAEAANNARGIISKKPNDNSTGYVFYKDGFYQSKINFRLKGSAAYDYIPSNSNVIINQWEFWTMVYNSTTGKVDIYKNGALDKTLNTGNIGNMTNTAPLYIGFSETWTGYFNGSIDDVRIYNRALSDAEVAALYGSENSSLSLTNPMRFGGGLSTLNVGTGYNLTAAIKNNGSTSWVGDVYLRVKGGTPVLLSSNNVIAAGGTYNLSANFSPQTAQIGQNVTMELLTKQGSNDFVRVATVNGTINPLTVNIEAASTVPVVKVPFIRLNQSEVSPGGVVQIVGGNFAPNTSVTIGSSPSIAGASYPSVRAGADGSISASFTVPTTYTERYLTLVGRDNQGNNPGASVAVKQPAEVATLSITSPYKSGETINITPNGKVSITFSDKLLKGTAYPQSGASRSYRYEIGYQLAGSTVFNSLYQMPAETGLLNSELRKTVTFSMIGSNFSTVSQSGGWPLKFIIKDMYNNQRVAESVQVNINVVQNISKVSLKWDRSFTPMPAEDPIGIAADGVARMYLVVEKNSPTGSPIQSVSVVLANPESNRDPNNFNNGTWLGRVKYAAQQNNNQYSEEANGINTITAQNNSTNADGKYWFWYVAPDDFMRDGLPEGSDYTNDSGREVAAKFTVTYVDGTSELVTKYILIVRPPLMLVHGLSGDEHTWDKFPLRNSYIFADKPVAVNMNPSGSFIDNALDLLGQNPLNQKSSLQSIIASFNKKGYACKRVDYTCHSMGGCMLRMAVQERPWLFYVGINSTDNFKNYGLGFINKFITINTPHNGSPVADLLVSMAPNLTKAIRVGLTANFKATNSERFKDYGFEKINSFIVPTNENDLLYTFRASSAVQNLQTNDIKGEIYGNGVRFKRTDLKAHMIASDIFYSQNRPATFDNQLKIIDTGLGFLYLFKQIHGSTKNYKNFVANPTSYSIKGLYNKYNVITGPKKLWNSFMAASYTNLSVFWILNANLTTSLEELMKVYGNWNQKYSDFMYNSDLVVPYMSQTANYGTSGYNVTTLSSNADEILDFDQIYRFSHIGITDQPEIGQAVKKLLNTSVISNKFGSIPPNTNPIPILIDDEPSLTIPQAMPNVSLNALNEPISIEKYDTLRIKITSPTNLSQHSNISSLRIKVKLKQKNGFKRINVTYGGTVLTDTVAVNEYAFDFPNRIIDKNNYVFTEAHYMLQDTFYVAYDSIIVVTTTSEQLSKFSVEPDILSKAVEQKFIPTYFLQYGNSLSFNPDKTKLSVSISNPACLSYNTQTGQFRGTQKGEAVVIFTYDGIFKDTMYVAVGGGGLPYSQQIQTSNVPVTGDGTICTGATISVPFTTSGGVFDVGNQYIVQLSDASGENFVSLTTTGTASPLLARIPNGLSNADTYKVRVVSTSPPVIGTAAAQTLKIRNQDATPIVSVQSGNWNDPATWSCKRIPSASDNVTIKAGHRVNLSVGAVGQCRNLTTERTAIFDCPTGAVFLANPNQ